MNSWCINVSCGVTKKTYNIEDAICNSKNEEKQFLMLFVC